jgi:hypothetical protein
MKAISEAGVEREEGSMESLTMVTSDARTSDKPIELARKRRCRLSLIGSGTECNHARILRKVVSSVKQTNRVEKRRYCQKLWIAVVSLLSVAGEWDTL